MREPDEIHDEGTIPPVSARMHRLLLGKKGHLGLSPELLKKMGASTGDELEIIEDGGKVEIRPNIHSLARVYIEPTSRCNLTCRTCIRNTWTEPVGDMDRATFDRLVTQLGRFPHLDSVMFGGFGEPTAHKEILEMIGRIKSLGVRAEMTTNGTNLDSAMLSGLHKNRLDRLWVSFDGADESNFESIRKGATFRSVVESMRNLQRLNRRHRHKIGIGIASVVMRKNIADLKNMDELARSLGADKVVVSNVLPYSEEMEKEMLCLLTLSTETFTFAHPKTEMSLPRLDVNSITRDAIFHLLRGYLNLTLMGNKIFAPARRCRFIEDRTTFIRWDGKVSPCMGLLHTYKTFLYGNERAVHSCSLGNINEHPLWKIWNSNEYRKFREKLRAFDFSPCHVCGGCNLLDENKEDCYGNTFPACGGCLWAQGVIQCP